MFTQARSSLLLEVPPIRLLGRALAGTSPPYCVLSPFVYLLKSSVFVFVFSTILSTNSSKSFCPPLFDLSPYTFAQASPLPLSDGSPSAFCSSKKFLERKESMKSALRGTTSLPTKPSLSQWPNCCEKGDELAVVTCDYISRAGLEICRFGNDWLTGPKTTSHLIFRWSRACSQKFQEFILSEFSEGTAGTSPPTVSRALPVYLLRSWLHHKAHLSSCSIPSSSVLYHSQHLERHGASRHIRPGSNSELPTDIFWEKNYSQ